MADDPSKTDATGAVPEAGAASEARPAESEAAEAAAAAKASSPGRVKHIAAGAALGIGSAALVAALLYANRSKKGDRKTD